MYLRLKKLYRCCCFDSHKDENGAVPFGSDSFFLEKIPTAIPNSHFSLGEGDDLGEGGGEVTLRGPDNPLYSCSSYSHIFRGGGGITP